MMVMKRWPVIEMFGPTIQGEGADQGAPCAFVRFGACDFRCDWCDTPHAVLPKEVATNKTMLDAEEICQRLWTVCEERGSLPEWVILSGGNPLMHELGGLVSLLQAKGFRVAVETQGSLWKAWLQDVDRLCISPKPPSSGMVYREGVLERFLDRTWRIMLTTANPSWAFLKVVVFDDTDLEWAESLHIDAPGFQLYLSAGNDAGRTVGRPEREDHRSVDQVRLDLIERGSWLAKRVLETPGLAESGSVQVQMQQHVLYWGNKQGV